MKTTSYVSTELGAEATKCKLHKRSRKTEPVVETRLIYRPPIEPDEPQILVVNIHAP